MTKEILLSLPENEIIKYLEDKHFRICTDMDEELNIWYEYKRQSSHGDFSFVEALSWIWSEEYMREDFDDQYIVLDDGYDFPKYWCSFNSLEDLINYFEDDLDFEENVEER